MALEENSTELGNQEMEPRVGEDRGRSLKIEYAMGDKCILG